MSLFVSESSVIRDTIEKHMPWDSSKTATAVALPNSRKPGYSAIYRNAYSPDKLIDKVHPLLTTIHELAQYCFDVYADQDFLGTRVKNPDGSFGEFKFATYREASEQKDAVGAGIFWILENNPYRTDSEAHRKIKYDPDAKESPFVLSIFATNRPEWLLTDFACWAYSITNTALYSTLGANTSTYILGLTESPIVICSKDKIQFLIDIKNQNPKELANLIAIVSMDDLSHSDDENLFSLAKENRISLLDFELLQKIGRTYPLARIPPSPDFATTISFTSGTTGAHPKGVVLTHRNAVAGTAFTISIVKHVKEGISYCFLPLAHIYQRQSIKVLMFHGYKLGFPLTPSPLSLFDDMKVLRPTVMNLVPRVYTKLEAAIKSQTLNSELAITKSLFNRAVATKMELQAQEGDNSEGKHIIYDRLSYLLRKKIGLERLVLFTSGSAPILPETIKFLKASLDVGFIQGYGLTETYSGVCASPLHESSPGSVGAIAVTTEIKLREVPEMNYFADSPGGSKGEILLRGPQIFSHYYKLPEQTAEAFDSEGWFKTGDVGSIDPKTGKIYIIDRVKNFFKLAQGEYITPDKIENTYLNGNPVVQQIFVHGNSLRSYLVAVVGVDPATIGGYISKQSGKSITEPAQIVEYFGNPDNKATLLKYMNQNIGGLLQGFEKVHNIYVDIEPLTIERDLITPTMKVKRPIAAKYFSQVFEDLYKEGSLIDKFKL